MPDDVFEELMMMEELGHYPRVVAFMEELGIHCKAVDRARLRQLLKF